MGCAILHEPPILFLDEPTSGVDPIARRGFWRLIYDLSEAGHTVFVTTHYMDEAEYCHRVALMYGGRVIALGSPAELKNSLGDGHLLNLESSDARGSLTVLEGKPEILEAAVFGAGLHLKVTDPGTAIPRIYEYLKQSGIHVLTLDSILPSMEDVFVSLIEKEEKAAMSFRRTKRRDCAQRNAAHPARFAQPGRGADAAGDHAADFRLGAQPGRRPHSHLSSTT